MAKLLKIDEVDVIERSEFDALVARVSALESSLPAPQPQPEPEPEPEPEQPTLSTRYEGAEGFAADCMGGRVDGAIDLLVNDFTDPQFTREDMIARRYKPGTLRWAMHQPIAKRIVFARPGLWKGWAPIQVTDPLESANFTFNETRQPVTIVGAIRLSAVENSVWLNTRFRGALWNNAYRPFSGGPQATGDCLHLSSPMNTLVMNCEFSGGADELFNVKNARGNSTIQDSVFCEGFKNGNFGMVWGDDNGHNYGAIFTNAVEGVGNLSLIRNLWCNLAKRCPTEVYSLPTNPRPRRTVVVNNLFYNWLAPCGSVESKEPTLILGNHWEAGPSTVKSGLGYCSSAHVVDSIVKTPQGEFSIAFRDTGKNPTVLRNYAAGTALTVVSESLPQELVGEVNATVMLRTEAIESVLANSGVFPLDNVSKANRQSFRDKTGWQGAHPDYVNGTLENYLNWATEIK